MCNINLNQDKNGIELSFENKPDSAILDSIKAAGFRWNRATRVWYAKQTPERMTFAQTLGEVKTAPAPVAIDTINMEGVGAKSMTCHGSEFAAVIRSELKARGVKGVTVRYARYSSYYLTVKATPDDFASVEEFKLRYPYTLFTSDISIHGRYTGERWIYSKEWEGLSEEERLAHYLSYINYEIGHRRSYNEHHRERDNYPNFTTAFCDRLDKIYRIANQWNYDNSDPYTDYYDVGYYLDIDIKAADFTPRENMTDAEKRAYAEEIERKETETAERMRLYEEERRAAEEARKAYETARKKAEALVYDNIRVEDLDDTERLFVDGLKGCHGKENSFEELRSADDRAHVPAVISRKVIFTDEAIFEEFGRYLLEEWVFVAGKGGTASEDVRLNNMDDFYKLTTDQRESIQFYNTDCVGVYVNDTLKAVIDPQGYNYPRYVYLADNATIKPAPAELERLKKESETKRPFYIPAPVSDQIKALNVGEAVTIYQCDGWMLTSIEGARGIITGITEGDYAQYHGFYIYLSRGGKEYRAFIRDNNKCLIYKGIKDKLPETITKRRISNNMYGLLQSDELFINTLNYYHEAPVLDTVPR